MLRTVLAEFSSAAGNDELGEVIRIWPNNKEHQQFLLTTDKFYVLRQAAEHGAENVLHFLLERITPEQRIEFLQVKDYYAFRAAAGSGKANVVKLIWNLTNNADLHRDMFRSNDYHAFISAVKFDRLEVIRFLWSVMDEEQKKIVLEKLINNKKELPLYKLSQNSLKILINEMADTASSELMPLIRQLPYFTTFRKNESVSKPEVNNANISVWLDSGLSVLQQKSEQISLARLHAIKKWSQTFYNPRKVDTNLLDVFNDIFVVIFPPEKREKIPNTPFYQVFANEGNIEIEPAKSQIGPAYKKFYHFMRLCGALFCYPNYPDSFPRLSREPEVLGRNWNVLNDTDIGLQHLVEWVKSIITTRVNPLYGTSLPDAAIERLQAKLNIILQASQDLNLTTSVEKLPAP